MIVRSGGEPAIVALLEALRDRVGRRESSEKVIIPEAPAHSHQMMGSCESIQAIRAQMRTLVLQLQWKVGIELPPHSLILPRAGMRTSHRARNCTRRRTTNRC